MNLLIYKGNNKQTNKQTYRDCLAYYGIDYNIILYYKYMRYIEQFIFGIQFTTFFIQLPRGLNERE